MEDDFKVYTATAFDIPRICSFLKSLKGEFLDPNLRITSSKSYPRVFSELLRITLLNSLQKKIIGYFSQMIVAVSSEKAIGIAYVGIRNEIATLHGLFVSKNYRNKGVGSTLLLDICLFCKRKNVNVIQLYVSQNNKCAISLYKKMGFTFCPSGVTVAEYDKSRARMEMVCELSPKAFVEETNTVKSTKLKVLSETA